LVKLVAIRTKSWTPSPTSKEKQFLVDPPNQLSSPAIQWNGCSNKIACQLFGEVNSRSHAEAALKSLCREFGKLYSQI